MDIIPIFLGSTVILIPVILIAWGIFAIVKSIASFEARFPLWPVVLIAYTFVSITTRNLAVILISIACLVAYFVVKASKNKADRQPTGSAKKESRSTIVNPAPDFD